MLKINQYESQFQSMSVLVRETVTGNCFIYAKGSPELIHRYSPSKQESFEGFVKTLSLEGYRSIGYGYRQVGEGEVEEVLVLDREEYLRGIEMLGLATFANRLKDDAASTLRGLAECQIDCKIITGDNIYLGVQTAFAVGMLPPHCYVVVLEGRHYN